MTEKEAEAVTNLGALLAAAHEVIAEQLEIRKRLEDEVADLKEQLRLGNGTYQVSLADQAQSRADAARYRWLRDYSCPPHQFYISVPDEFHGVRFSPPEVDEYIDRARAALQDTPRHDA